MLRHEADLLHGFNTKTYLLIKKIQIIGCTLETLEEAKYINTVIMVPLQIIRRKL